MFRDPVGDALLIAWGDVFELDGDGRAKLKPYEPLPRYASEEERRRLARYLAPSEPAGAGVRVPDVG